MIELLASCLVGVSIYDSPSDKTKVTVVVEQDNGVEHKILVPQKDLGSKETEQALYRWTSELTSKYCK